MSLVLRHCQCVVIMNEVSFKLNIIEVVLIIKDDAKFIYIYIFLIDVVVVNLLLFQCIDGFIYIYYF